MPSPARSARQMLTESELAATLETSAPRIARLREAGKIRCDGITARGRQHIYDASRIPELREALTKTTT